MYNYSARASFVYKGYSSTRMLETQAGKLTLEQVRHVGFGETGF